MNPERPADFSAVITLLSSEAGGRREPLVQGHWRTILGVGDEHWSAMLMFEGAPGPGETFNADVWLLIPDALKHFPAHTEFSLREAGAKGVGRVLSLG